MMRWVLPVTMAGAWIVFSATLVHGDELGRLREEYERSVREKARLLDETHRLNLRQLERQLAESGDYETALGVKERIDALEVQMNVAGATPAGTNGGTATGSAAGAGSSASKALLLRAQSARPLPGASYDRALDAVELRKRGGQAQWDVNRCTPGLYDVFLTYSVAVGLPPVAKGRAASSENTDSGSKLQPVGGTLGFSEVTSLGGRPDAGIVRAVTQTTGGTGQFVTEHLGRHDLRHASATFRIEAVDAEAGGLLRVKKVELVPVTPENSTAGPDAPAVPTASPATLEQLQREYRGQIQPLIEPVRQRYDGALAELEQHLKTKGDSEGLAAVQAERRRLAESRPASAKPDIP